jgi:hypothetical protein
MVIFDTDCEENRAEWSDLMNAQAASLAPVWDNAEDEVWDNA